MTEPHVSLRVTSKIPIKRAVRDVLVHRPDLHVTHWAGFHLQCLSIAVPLEGLENAQAWLRSREWFESMSIATNM